MLSEKKRQVVLSPEDPVARYELGEALFAEADHDGAEKQLTRALALDPDHAAARRLLARTLRAQDRAVPAERTLDEALQRDPDDVAAREEMAELLIAACRYDEAILHLEEALRTTPEQLSRRLRVIDLTLLRGLHARCERHLAEARRRAPGDPEVASRTGALSALLGRAAGVLRSPLAEGREALLGRSRRALDGPPFAAAVRSGPLRAVVVALREGDVAAAKRGLVTAPAEVQKEAAFELLRAEVTLLEADRAKAETAFRRATARAPEEALGWARLGEILLAGGRPEEAVPVLEAAVTRAPREGETLEMLGDALFALGRAGEALARYEAAMELRPEVFLGAKIAELRTPGRASAGGAAVGRIGALAWSPTGGTVSPLQAEVLPGRGELRLTGNVRGSGQESARVVHSYLTSRAAALGIAEAAAQRDLHLHYADAEVTKEGMSAGLPLALAALSAYLDRPLPAGLAATGQLTLDGAVMAVAGLAEKLLAAYLADVHTVIVPRKNLFAIRRLPTVASGNLCVVFVDSLREAIEAVWERV